MSAVSDYARSKMVDVLKANNLPVNLPSPDEVWGGDYNCWGFCAYYHGWEEQAVWLGDNTMETYLRDRTKPVIKPEPGDIAVLRWPGAYERLVHTAIVVDEMHVIHKPGACPLCIDLHSDMLGENYSYSGCFVTYRRKV